MGAKNPYILYEILYIVLVGASLYNDEGRASVFNFFLFVAKNKTGFKKYIFYFLHFFFFFYFFSVFWILPVQIHLFHEK